MARPNFKIRKLPEKMISINFLSMNVDYVSIFIQGPEPALFFGSDDIGKLHERN